VDIFAILMLSAFSQRKMISMAILATRTKTPASVVPKTFGKLHRLTMSLPSNLICGWLTGSDGVHIPKAPALGLLLEQPRFGSYNQKLNGMRKQNAQNQNTPVSDFENSLRRIRTDRTAPSLIDRFDYRSLLMTTLRRSMTSRSSISMRDSG
jgi:hypothetical protein